MVRSSAAERLTVNQDIAGSIPAAPVLLLVYYQHSAMGAFIMRLRNNMTPNEYQRLAMRTANPECKSYSNVGLGLAGESGEVADMIKKHLHHGHPLDRDHLAKELRDVLWYVALGCDVLGISMEDVMRRNIDKLKKRYPDGFSEERSLHRSEGDI